MAIINSYSVLLIHLFNFRVKRASLWYSYHSSSFLKSLPTKFSALTLQEVTRQSCRKEKHRENDRQRTEFIDES